ncbi:glycosyltransferase [Halomonas saccharevitans]|uniref:Glycosyltransferase n=1 Tax=Halomonas saccharevitans TaxID=416872 RepID=A0ABU3NDQ3_9GAMM|nr:glycosyltransferase [Halomonas saccharevitans]MDT8878306.1 glycosyltransferase [Halomonas saccharevitans]
MKVLLVITSLSVGGAERLVTSLADEYVANGHEVILVRFHGDEEVRPSDSRVRLVNLEMQRSPLGVLTAMVRLRFLIRSFRADVINSHLVHANILIRVLRLVTPMSRLVNSMHNSNEEGLGRMLAYRLTDHLADVCTNVSQEAVEAFERQGALKPGRMLAIHNGIDTESFVFDSDERQRVRTELGLAENTSLLLAVGRLSDAKDYPNLLRAFARLEACPMVPQLVIVGDGPLRHDLEALADSHGIKDRVRFLGVRHDVPELMSACDLFVLSSAWEGFGLVVAEAMSCRRPVVATDCGGVREVVGSAGFLVPPKDSAALGEAIERALGLSNERREKLGAAARERVVERYSLQATAERYLAVYGNDNHISKE